MADLDALKCEPRVAWREYTGDCTYHWHYIFEQREILFCRRCWRIPEAVTAALRFRLAMGFWLAE